MRSVFRTPETETQVNARYTSPEIPLCFSMNALGSSALGVRAWHRPSKRTNFTPNWHAVSRYAWRNLAEDNRSPRCPRYVGWLTNRLAAGFGLRRVGCRAL